MSCLKDMANYCTAVTFLERIFGKQELFQIEFSGRYLVAITRARTEFGESLGRSRAYDELGPNGERAFQELQQWVLDNYPWPAIEGSPAEHMTGEAKNPLKELTTFRTLPSDKERLAELAERDDRTVSYLVNVAVREFLERNDAGSKP